MRADLIERLTVAVATALDECLTTLEHIQRATLDEDGDIDYYEVAATGILKIKAIRALFTSPVVPVAAKAEAEGPKHEFFLHQTWSARLRHDGKPEPGVQISGNGIAPYATGDKAGMREMARFWAEKLGRIEKGAPLFHIDAPFILDEVPAAPTCEGEGQ